MSPTTLVILGSSITALAVARDARAHGLRPVVVDVAGGIALRSRWVTPVRVADVHGDATLDAVLDFAGADAVLVSTADLWLQFVIDHRPLLDAAFAKVLHPRNTMLQICLRKDAFARWCHDHDLPTPAVWLPDGGGERPATFQFPMLVRPSRTPRACATPALPKAVEVHDEAELRDWIARLRAAACTPVVSASLLRHRLTQFSVPFARSAAGTLSFVARKLRPHAGRCAQGSLVEWCHGADEAPIERLALQAIECADYHGIGEVEILHAHDTQRSHLIEINARPWLQYALAPASGHDLLGWMLQAAPERRAAPRGRCTWLNLRDDRFQVFSAAAGAPPQERPGLAAYLRTIVRSNVYAVFDPRDPMPLIRMLLRCP